jgi:prepilin-type N-terminal cleavage/methylation domain-containing protein
MPRSAARRGYTLVETIVGLMVFSVGGLALTSTAALIGRQLKFDDLRERAARVAVSRLEVLRASCLQATSGSELVQGVRSTWSVTTDSSGRAGLIVSVTYASSNGARSDAYRSIAQCR